MMVDRLRPQKAKVAVGQREKRRSRTGRYLALVFGAGAISGVAALAGIPPFGSLQALLAPASEYVHPQSPITPIQASTIFPSVPPVHKTVDVYDLAPPAQRSSPPPVATSPRPTTSPRPATSPSPKDD